MSSQFLYSAKMKRREFITLLGGAVALKSARAIGHEVPAGLVLRAEN
jgi:hypothetical protein